MSETLPIGAAASGHQVRAAIARAASRTGVDFDYLLAQAKIESSLDPSARARTSSAAGLYQFTQGTWLRTLERHGAAHGIDWADAAIDNGRVVDPALRSQIMALRHDPDMAALMAGELANDNRAALTGVLGREPDAAELYLAHFLGAAGAGQFLSALESNPGMSAASLMPRAAAANRAIFYEGNGAPRSVAGMMDLIRGKVARAMEGGEGPGFTPSAPGLPEARLAAAAPDPHRVVICNGD
ncbi:MAG TPA: lytic transglycosylase domain-containing protein, partial [Novosphingobium sp.]|nr:lytic transglycosylase domain-containing protein [Novosphingobium sp.]